MILLLKLTWIRGKNRRSQERLQWLASQSEPQALHPGRSWWLLLYVSGRRIGTFAPGRWRTTNLRQTESKQKAQTHEPIISRDQKTEMFDCQWCVLQLLINSHFQWRGELYQKTAPSQRRGKTRRTRSAPSQFLMVWTNKEVIMNMLVHHVTLSVIRIHLHGKQSSCRSW